MGRKAVMAQVRSAAEEGLDETDGPWAHICPKHSVIVNHLVPLYGLSTAEFCDECR